MIVKKSREHSLQASRWWQVSEFFASLPYWLLIIALVGLFLLWHAATDENYRVIFSAVAKGIGTTLYVSLIAYLFSAALGLIIGLMRMSLLRPLREAATLYTEIIRGVPMLVILYYIAFVGAPSLVRAINWLAQPLIAMEWFAPINVRALDFVWRAILALTVGYSAFISEIFRAGIESVAKGQMEAARALGMTRWQAMLHVVLPQAFRNVLPPLCNEFVAMIKDSALVSALGVQDITQLGKVYSASTFKFFETYNVVAYLYLIMTISLSLMVRGLEHQLDKRRVRRM
ncbi:amino acid ABC transporter membrane protein, PAAT family [Candidatus Moduliflexus flocculans]|uniref:Amino acid ABC transporter membrane protein, PAAT family n=1 Tax=Candidatus Moduliflexus flocculans TaxID=1499966 RepID=A0A0S6VTB5_9BACT|nr:amino acid ABC transporter membrane protein, PAAT family [Candidatus Moduliflexus flocculans]